VINGEKTEVRLCGVLAMMASIVLSGKKSLKGRFSNGKNDFLKLSIYQRIRVLVRLFKVKLFDG
jgi:hypothetical protein